MRKRGTLIRVRMASLWARMGSGEFVRDNIFCLGQQGNEFGQTFQGLYFQVKECNKATDCVCQHFALFVQSFPKKN